VYKKLRLLVDRGCIFIGHGLSKDFRIISEPHSSFDFHSPRSPYPLDIYVPPEQVYDTVDLYFLKERQRRLSLRFLSWFVLHENIQTDTHDSIEDARSALMLYKAYEDIEEQGIIDEKLDELYREGRKHVCFHSYEPQPCRSHCAELETSSPSEDGARLACGTSTCGGCDSAKCPPHNAQQHDTRPFCPERFPRWRFRRFSAKWLAQP
jgi:hypothetical protein